MTMRQLSAILIFLLLSGLGLTLVYRWLRAERKKLAIELEAAKKREFESEELDAAKRREIDYERRFVAQYTKHLRAAVGNHLVSVGGEATGNCQKIISLDATAAYDRNINPTDAVLDATFGCGSVSLKAPRMRTIESHLGPRFGTVKVATDDEGVDLSYCSYEERSGTKLLAQIGLGKNREVWALSIHVPYMEEMSQWRRPRAFGEPGFEWTKVISFRELGKDDYRSAIDELQEWFLRILTGEESPGSGSFTNSCSDWNWFTRDPADRICRVIWVSRKEDDRFTPNIWGTGT